MGKEFKFSLDGISETFPVKPIVIEGLSHSVNLGLDFLQQTSAHINCGKSQVKLCFGEGKSERYTRLVTANQTPFPFKGRGKMEKQGEEFSKVLGRQDMLSSRRCQNCEIPFPGFRNTDLCRKQDGARNLHTQAVRSGDLQAI